MTVGVNTTRLLPDPDLVSKAIAHRKQEIQVTIDAMASLHEEAVKGSRPFATTAAISRLHPLFKSTIQEIA